MKEKVAEDLAARVKSGEVLGVGTGSTVALAVQRIGERVKREKLEVYAVPTSLQTSWMCESFGIKVLFSGYKGMISWGFDGADAVDSNFHLIKGRGGALLQEKILAARCSEFVIIVDDSKLVKSLAGIPIPIEVIPTALGHVERELQRLGAASFEVRPCQGGKHGPVITEAGNIIVDAAFPKVDAALEDSLKGIVGVVESGLFTKYGTELLVGSARGVERRKRPVRA